jgi:hypothetical protein
MKIYEFRLENDDLGVCEEVVIKDDNSYRALSDAIGVFVNRLKESDEVITGKNFAYIFANNIMSVYNNEGWNLGVKEYDHYDPDLIDVINC